MCPIPRLKLGRDALTRSEGRGGLFKVEQYRLIRYCSLEQNYSLLFVFEQTAPA